MLLTCILKAYGKSNLAIAKYTLWALHNLGSYQHKIKTPKVVIDRGLLDDLQGSMCASKSDKYEYDDESDIDSLCSDDSLNVSSSGQSMSSTLAITSSIRSVLGNCGVCEICCDLLKYYILKLTRYGDVKCDPNHILLRSMYDAINRCLKLVASLCQKCLGNLNVAYASIVDRIQYCVY